MSVDLGSVTAISLPHHRLATSRLDIAFPFLTPFSKADCSGSQQGRERGREGGRKKGRRERGRKKGNKEGARIKGREGERK